MSRRKKRWRKRLIATDKRASRLDIDEVTSPRDSGRFRGVSIGRDENGFFVMTHRSRSKSYEQLRQIPNSLIKRIASTG